MLNFYLCFFLPWQESRPLWQLQVQWSAANQSPEETEAVFKVESNRLPADSISTGKPTKKAEVKKERKEEKETSWAHVAP